LEVFYFFLIRPQCCESEINAIRKLNIIFSVLPSMEKMPVECLLTKWIALMQINFMI